MNPRRRVYPIHVLRRVAVVGSAVIDNLGLQTPDALLGEKDSDWAASVSTSLRPEDPSRIAKMEFAGVPVPPEFALLYEFVNSLDLRCFVRFAQRTLRRRLAGFGETQ